MVAEVSLLQHDMSGTLTSNPPTPKKKKKSPLPLPFHLLLPLLPLNGYIVLVIQPKSFSASSCEGVFASV